MMRLLRIGLVLSVAALVPLLAAAGQQAPVRVGGDVAQPRKIKSVAPVYPAIAKSAGVSGAVILEVTIGPDGHVTDTRILRSVPLLDQAAIDAVRQWVYQPMLLNGVPTSVIMTTTVTFTLDSSSSFAQSLDMAKMYYTQGRIDDAERMLMQARTALAQERTGGSLAAAPAPPADTPLRVGGDIKEPRKVRDVKPVYPPDALAAGVQGVVILETVIGPDGTVRDARVLRSQPMLDQAALEAVRQWEFTPTLLNGVPVSVIMTVTVNFSM